MQNRIRVWAEPQITPDSKIILEIDGIKMGGKFKAELLDVSTSNVLETREFPNLILNRWMNGMFLTSSFFPQIDSALNALVIGTGSVTGANIPQATDTQLHGEIFDGRTTSNGGISSVWSFVSASDNGPYWNYNVTRQFSENAGNGVITEFGWSPSTIYNNIQGLSVRSAVKDATGSLAPITKTNENQLRLTYDLRFYLPTASVTSSFELNGQWYTASMAPINLSDANAWGSLGFPFYLRLQGSRGAVYENVRPATSLTSDIIFSGSFTTTTNANGFSIQLGRWLDGQFSQSMYIPNDFYTDLKLNFEPSEVNFTTGIQGISWSTGPGLEDMFSVIFSPKIPKTNLQRFLFVVRHTWGRIEL